MTLYKLLALWPWTCGYVLAAAAVFVLLRRTGSTDREAAALFSEPRGFGPPCTLRHAGYEFLRSACPLLLLAVTLFGWLLRAWMGHIQLTDVFVAVGVIAYWPFQEWLIHALLLHWKPFKVWGICVDPILARNHRNHHRDPWRAQLGITPSYIIWFYIVSLPPLWIIVFPISQALTGLSMFFSLALNYEWLHYLIHTSYVPHTRLYRRLWRNHRLHHFKNEHYWYGVSMLSADLLLKTKPSAQCSPHSESCFTLAVGQELQEWTEPTE